MTLIEKLPGGRYLPLLWPVSVALIAGLGWLRFSTEAEYAFSSAAILPVLLISWAGGFRHGVLAATLAAQMWLFTDQFTGQLFSHEGIPYLNAGVRFATYLLIAYLVDLVRHLLLKEIEHAITDPLTGLANRRAFLNTGEEEIRRAKRYGGKMSVAFLDLDNFKQINDRHGHDVGDSALRKVGEALKSGLRDTDTVARFGGDEFAVLLHETDAQATIRTGEKIAATLRTALAQFPSLSVSIGVAWFDTPPATFETMLKAADQLMYEVKWAGKNAVRIGSFDCDGKPVNT